MISGLLSGSSAGSGEGVVVPDLALEGQLAAENAVLRAKNAGFRTENAVLRAEHEELQATPPAAVAETQAEGQSAPPRATDVNRATPTTA